MLRAAARSTRTTAKSHPHIRAIHVDSTPSTSRVTLEKLQEFESTNLRTDTLRSKRSYFKSPRARFARSTTRNARRVGVGAEAVLASSSYIDDKAASPVATPAPKAPAPEPVDSTRSPWFADLPPIDILPRPTRPNLRPEPPGLRAALHNGGKVPRRALEVYDLSDRTLVLLVRRLGLPSVKNASAPVVAHALTFGPGQLREDERLWLESYVTQLLSVPDAAHRAFVFHVTARIGAPGSIRLLRTLIENKVVDPALVPVQPPTETDIDTDAFVRATLARAARSMDMPVLAADLGGGLAPAHTRGTVLAMARSAAHPSADPEDVQRWMGDAARWGEYGLVARVWARSPRVAPTAGAALGLLRHLLKEGKKGAARLLASDVLEDPGYELEEGFRSRFVGLCAEQGFAKSARRGWERYFEPLLAPPPPPSTKKTKKANLKTPAPKMNEKDGALVPWMSLRLVSLFLSLSSSPLHTELVPDAHEFALRVAAALPTNPTTDAQRTQMARTYFLLAHHAPSPPSDATASSWRQRALALLAAPLAAHHVPDPRTANLLVHELAQHSLPDARQALKAMRRRDVGPDGVALGSVAIVAGQTAAGGVKRVLEHPRSVGMLTDVGRRGVLRVVAGDQGDEDEDVRSVVRELKDPALRRWFRNRGRGARTEAS
ncbi:hypothetical protein EXIGLDRAFT_698683 [Exidia glandulosa HHB12029]|uniref:Uncharacterized protein n=1 Tax=Exidia glandulosa HHB12029 TaxID=1314781 RepID=A0A165E6H3_EXIGL|nr:hypothetical protein EXIGLDRAFT_698683 [Exidia glandulosa HHB12029]